MKTTMPAVLTIHDTLYWSHPELMSTPLYTGPVKWMETRAARNAAHVITDSEASAVDIRKYLRVPPDRLHVVPLAATPVPARVAEKPPTGDVVLLASGQRRPHKNWEGLIEALALHRRRPTGRASSSPAAAATTRSAPSSTGSGSATTSSCAAGSRRTSWPPSTAGRPRWCSRRSSRGSACPSSRRCRPACPCSAPTSRRTARSPATPRSGSTRTTAPRSPPPCGRRSTDPDRMARLRVEGPERARLFSWQRVADETLAVFRTALHATR